VPFKIRLKLVSCTKRSYGTLPRFRFVVLPIKCPYGTGSEISKMLSRITERCSEWHNRRW